MRLPQRPVNRPLRVPLSRSEIGEWGLSQEKPQTRGQERLLAMCPVVPVAPKKEYKSRLLALKARSGGTKPKVSTLLEPIGTSSFYLRRYSTVELRKAEGAILFEPPVKGGSFRMQRTYDSLKWLNTLAHVVDVVAGVCHKRLSRFVSEYHYIVKRFISRIKPDVIRAAPLQLLIVYRRLVKAVRHRTPAPSVAFRQLGL